MLSLTFSSPSVAGPGDTADCTSSWQETTKFMSRSHSEEHSLSAWVPSCGLLIPSAYTHTYNYAYIHIYICTYINRYRDSHIEYLISVI